MCVGPGASRLGRPGGGARASARAPSSRRREASRPAFRSTHASSTSPPRQAWTRPTIYGGVDRKRYILETIGCGCAFFDFDNDGWLDIFLLNGHALEGAEGATNRLYKNNRDGTFTDVTERAGLVRTGGRQV